MLPRLAIVATKQILCLPRVVLEDVRERRSPARQRRDTGIRIQSGIEYGLTEETTEGKGQRERDKEEAVEKKNNVSPLLVGT